MSLTAAILPIIKSLCVASQFLGINPDQVQATNQQQDTFLKNHFVNRKELASLTDSELRAWASRNHQELNTILERENFNIKLEPFDQQSFGVVSILDVQTEWVSPGTKTDIIRNEKSYPAVKINDDFSIFSSKNHPHPLVRINTKSGDSVWMTIADQSEKEPLKDFTLLERIKSIKNNSECSNQRYGSVEFPMVNLDQQVNIDWLVGMALGDWLIAQAKQQTKFKMNEVGARARSAAVAISIKDTCPRQRPPDLMIDKPFLTWIERQGVTEPLFAGYITEQDWKKPENLGL